MKACLDVHYHQQSASAAAVVFDDWAADKPAAEYVTAVTGGVEYRPGRFYLREFAPLLAVIECIAEPVEVFIIDGYCTLSAAGAPGLGAHLYAAMEQRAAVIGVAKSRYRGTDHAAEVIRGGSQRPLFVTSLGMPQRVAASRIASLAGRYRMPKLLKAVDRLARR